MKIILIGNPNVGKSVIFNQLTGRYVSVSNYPGTTVEISRGRLQSDKNVTIIDTPGVNSLTPNSEDERITRDILFKEKPDLVVQVADAKNLKRSLLLSLQLIETKIPLILDLNMVDEMDLRGITVDSRKIADRIGVPVVETIAVQRYGMTNLISALKKPKTSDYRFSYPSEIESAIMKLEPILSKIGFPSRSTALMFLSADKSIGKKIEEKLDATDILKVREIRDKLKSTYSIPLSYVINRTRTNTVAKLLEDAVTKEKPLNSGVISRLGDLSMNTFWGVPILLLVLYLVYQFVGVIGAQILVDYFESTIFGGYINPISTKVVYSLIPWQIMRDLLVGEYGLITMALSYGFAIILPIVTTFFIAFGILEDSGYLPRLAVMLNKLFALIGLNGRAVMPMILGLGCDTMATMTTRTLETRKERLQVTLLLALAIPCSAQLGVILGMLSVAGTKVLFLWVFTVICVLILVGYLTSKILSGEKSDFIVEIPPLRIPQIGNILVKTLARLEWYLHEVIPLFILGTLILFFLDISGILLQIEVAASPLIEGWLDLPREATGAFLIGFLRRDYGAAGLFDLMAKGLLSNQQVLISLVTLTLFMPCIANLLVIIKEQGFKTALYISAFIFPFAFLIGGLMNLFLNYFGVVL